MNQKISVTFNTDNEGFVSHECPRCKKRFKVQLGKGSNLPISHCPYCSHRGKDCWMTDALQEYIGAVAVNQAIRPKLNQMNRRHNKGPFGFEFTLDTPKHPKAPLERQEDWPIVRCNSCTESIRHLPHAEARRCVCCGSTDLRKLESGADQE